MPGQEGKTTNTYEGSLTREDDVMSLRLLINGVQENHIAEFGNAIRAVLPVANNEEESNGMPRKKPSRME